MLLRLFVLTFCCLGFNTARAESPAGIDWSGFYLGGSVGANMTRAETSTTVADSVSYFTPPDPLQISNAGKGGSDLSEWNESFGLQGGYGHQFGGLFIGIEASAQTLSFSETRSRTVEYLSSSGNDFTLRQSVEAQWMASLRPRLGWAQDRWLAYVTGGVAMTRVEMDYRFNDTTSFVASSRSKSEKTKLGWTAGIGGEYAIDENWSIRTEYLYSNFGSLGTASDVMLDNGGFTASLNHSADLQVHSAMLGVSYRFGAL